MRALTPNASELVRKAKAFVDREIVLIPNGVDADLFQPMERTEPLADALCIEKEERVIGFVGELREKKGLTTLLRAYAQINKSHPTTLLIVGKVRGGDDQERFDELKSSILKPKIIVTGYVSNSDFLRIIH
jgi:glycosyltransferase involved in cell wall biosynthesis